MDFNFDSEISHNKTAAGTIGTQIQVYQTSFGLGAIWMNVMSPRLASLACLKQWSEYIKLKNWATTRGVCTSTIVTLAFIAATYLARKSRIQFAERLGDFWVLITLGTTSILLQLTHSQSVLCRSLCKELPSRFYITSVLLFLTLSCYLTQLLGSNGLALAFCVVALFYLGPVTNFYFKSIFQSITEE